MALRAGDKANFETLLRAARNGDLALVETERQSNGEYVALIVAMGREDGELVMTPLGEMVSGDPFTLYKDPATLTDDPHFWNPNA